MAGAHPVSCNIRRGNFIAKFRVDDLDIEPGNAELILTFETIHGDVMSAFDSVSDK